MFDATETIRVGSRQVADVVVELQDFRLIGEDDTQWDVMGAAYEQYTAEVLKREGGEFFTNRLAVALLTRLVDPQPDDLVLDPAGGTGGFCTAAMRYQRNEIRESDARPAVKARRMAQLKDRIFYIDIKHRLVKIAKAAMILTGNGHRGFTQGDSLAPFDRLPATFLERCVPGHADRVLTNPPFAGTTNGKIDAPAEMVPQFELARRWIWKDEAYVPTRDPLPGGVPPELLFIERCIQWLKPGGVLGIVVPKGVLENPLTTLAARHFIFRNAFVRAVIACHKNTFQPYTGSRTALLVLQKKTDAERRAADPDYPILMAVSRKIGQDSEGVPIFKHDETGQPSAELDHDLDDIYAAWEAHLAGRLVPSEFTFAVRRSQLNPRTLIVSPQAFLPSLNDAIAAVVRLGESDRFTVSTLRQIASRIYKGTRFKREDLETSEPATGDVVLYYTPAALLQEHGESIKHLDLQRADTRRRKEIEAHRLMRLDLLVTRSGTIGRVILTARAQEGHVGSDDLIHIDIDNENVKLFVYQFLKSELGQKQMKKDEYGTIQQHLEPAHLREVLIPLPNDPGEIAAIADTVRAAMVAREASAENEESSAERLHDLLLPYDAAATETTE